MARVSGPGAFPQMLMEPASGVSSPFASFISVVLPLPLGPSSPTTRPLSTVMSTFSSACTCP